MNSRQLNREFSRLLVKRIPREEISALAKFDRGQLLVRATQKLDRLPYLDQGRLDIVMQLDAEGTELVPVSFDQGEIALLSTLFSGGSTTSNIVAQESCRIRWLSKSAIEMAVVADSELSVLLIRFLSERLRENRVRERTWLMRSVDGRVRAILARSFSVGDRKEGDRIISFTHEKLARRCGVSRPKISLALKQLEISGILKLHRGSIEILDYQKLIQ